MPNPATPSVLPDASQGWARSAVGDAMSAACQLLRQLAGFAADLVFITDAEGRFVHISPDHPLGWPRDALLGQPSTILLGGPPTADPQSNPFCPAEAITRRHVWLRRHDGASVLAALSAAPRSGRQNEGACGLAIDLYGGAPWDAHMAERLRRMEVLDLVTDRLNCAGRAESTMDSVLSSLLHAIGAEGVAVIGAAGPSGEVAVLHECGPGMAAVQDTAFKLLAEHDGSHGDTAPDGRLVALTRFPTRPEAEAALVVWRASNGLPWTERDIRFAASAMGIIRIIMDHEAMRTNITHVARIDPLTGLLNRQTFLEDLKRHIARLDREEAPGTMLLIDLDGFAPINDRLGHAIGDRILVQVADRLRTWVRPNDLVARLGGDEFAVWLNGTDHLTAAERADTLCRTLPGQMEESGTLNDGLKVGLSVGIATRHPGGNEAIDDVLRRADLAMYDVKRNGRGHWRVSLENQM